MKIAYELYFYVYFFPLVSWLSWIHC